MSVGKNGKTILLIQIRNTNVLFCSLKKDSYAIKVCVAVFFCIQKLKHCRDPPKINLLKNKLIGGNKNEI